MSEHPKEEKRSTKFYAWVTITIVGILVAGSGFVFKLTEFIKIAQTRDAEGFALVPVTIYFCVTGGFLCLFIWNYMRGGFDNVEAPKYELLKRNEEIDAHDAKFLNGTANHSS